jgi:hypothetical protein
MPDSFDRRRGEESGDERSSLLGEETEGGRLEKGEEEEEFQARPYSDGSVISDKDKTETVLPNNDSSMSSPSHGESTEGRALALFGGGQMKTNDWQCDYPNCGRLFQKRHDLKQVLLFHSTPNFLPLTLLSQILIFRTVAIRNIMSNCSNVPNPLALLTTLYFLLRKTFTAIKGAMVTSGTFVLTLAASPQLVGSSTASLERTTGEGILNSSILEL